MKIQSFIRYSQISTSVNAAAKQVSYASAASKFRMSSIFIQKSPELKPAGGTGGDKPGGVTTLALGEETGGLQPAAPSSQKAGQVTTLALGEEGTGFQPSPWQPANSHVTTLALGEEGGGLQPAPSTGQKPGQVTTLALGEEGAGLQPADPANQKPGQVTTLAIGEEVGGLTIR